MKSDRSGVAHFSCMRRNTLCQQAASNIYQGQLDLPKLQLQWHFRFAFYICFNVEIKDLSPVEEFNR